MTTAGISWAFRISLVQRELFAVEADVVAGHEHVCERGPHFQRIALADHEIRDLARLQAADPVGNTEHFSGVDRERPERLVARQSPRDGFGCVVWQLPRV